MGQKPWYRGLNIILKNICYHEFIYGLVFFNIFDLFDALLLTHAEYVLLRERAYPILTGNVI